MNEEAERQGGGVHAGRAWGSPGGGWTLTWPGPGRSLQGASQGPGQILAGGQALCKGPLIPWPTFLATWEPPILDPAHQFLLLRSCSPSPHLMCPGV